jgi:aryl-alcohol dehydrogenase-like predicted oxidoreductase
MTRLFPPCKGSGLRLGLGGAPLGNLFAPVAEADAQALLAAAWDSGCRSFDTAPHYGHGLSEQRLRAALLSRPRDAFVLSSKVGRLLTPCADAPREQHDYVGGLPFVQHWDYSAAGVRRSVEDSLRRLGLERLDVAYVHDCDAATHGERAPQVLRQVIDETLPALRGLQREGVVGAVGLGVNDVQVVLDVLRERRWMRCCWPAATACSITRRSRGFGRCVWNAASMSRSAASSTPACWPPARAAAPRCASTTRRRHGRGSSAPRASRRCATSMACRCARRRCSSHSRILRSSS